MFSPLNDPQVTDWFRRLDAAWKRMPTEEQAWQREEVQQHLEGLVASKVAAGQLPQEAWNAALIKFGDPTQIGREVYQEWKQSKTGFRADMSAILFGLSLYIAQFIGIEALASLWVFKFVAAHGAGSVHFTNKVENFYFYLSAALIYTAIGRKYPASAIKGAFYTSTFWLLWMWMSNVTLAVIHFSNVSQAVSVVFAHFSLSVLLWMMIWHLTVAYLASVTKRGWYRPTLDDFKLTLPRKRQVG